MKQCKQCTQSKLIPQDGHLSNYLDLKTWQKGNFDCFSKCHVSRVLSKLLDAESSKYEWPERKDTCVAFAAYVEDVIHDLQRKLPGWKKGTKLLIPIFLELLLKYNPAVCLSYWKLIPYSVYLPPMVSHIPSLEHPIRDFWCPLLKRHHSHIPTFLIFLWVPSQLELIDWGWTFLYCHADGGFLKRIKILFLIVPHHQSIIAEDIKNHGQCRFATTSLYLQRDLLHGKRLQLK